MGNKQGYASNQQAIYRTTPPVLDDGDEIALQVNASGEMKTAVGASVETSFDHGRNSDVDASAEQITATSVACKKGVLVKAANANTGIIYVGNSDVTAASADATDGFELGAGESVFIEVDNVNKVYVIGSAANQAVYWMSV